MQEQCSDKPGDKKYPQCCSGPDNMKVQQNLQKIKLAKRKFGPKTGMRRELSGSEVSIGHLNNRLCAMVLPAFELRPMVPVNETNFVVKDAL